MNMTENETKSLKHWLDVLHHLVTKYGYDMVPERDPGSKKNFKFIYIGPKSPADLMRNFDGEYRRLTLTGLDAVREIRSSLLELMGKYGKTLEELSKGLDVPKSHLHYVQDEPFWFEAQTGIVRDEPPSYSNFHQFKFKGDLRPEIERIAAETKIDDAGNLLYTAETLKWLWDNQEPETRGKDER
jgi:hypothetical protein